MTSGISLTVRHIVGVIVTWNGKGTKEKKT